MRRYYFIFSGTNYKKLEKLIDYTERKYNLSYLETRDFPSSLSLSLKWPIQLDIGNFKQIVFNGNGKNIPFLCKGCRFSLCVNKRTLDNKRAVLFECTNCGLPIFEKKEGKIVPIWKHIIKFAVTP